jgi:hypothetical protein
VIVTIAADEWTLPDIIGIVIGRTAAKFIRIVGCLPLIVSVSGCWLPIPHTSRGSPGFKGRVLDAVSRVPVAHAEVQLAGYPQIHTYSHADGKFYLPSQRNFHLLVSPGACSDVWPEGKYYWTNAVVVSCNPYLPKRVGFDPETRFDETHEVGEIVLERAP